MLHIGICDVQVNQSIRIKQILKKLFGEHIKITVCESTFALENYVVDLRGGRVDIIFLDMGQRNKEFLPKIVKLKEKYLTMKLVFLGEDAEKMIEHIGMEPSWMLLRPITEEKIQEAMNHILAQTDARKRQLWIFEGHQGMFLIPKDDILYLESENREISVVMMEDKEEKGSGKLSTHLKELGEDFYQCHQSYIVNMAKVWQLTSKEIILFNNKRVPVSRPRYKETKEALKQYVERSNFNIK